MVAKRIASTKGGAVLVSDDGVHHNASGDTEAHSVGLHRVKELDEAMEHLQLLTPAGKLVRDLIAPAWPDLRQAIKNLPESVSLFSVSEPRFIQGKPWPSRASARISVMLSPNAMLEGDLVILTENGAVSRIELTDLAINKKAYDPPAISLELGKQLPRKESDYDERVAALRKTLGANQ
jgi:hypothetical protein